MVKWRLVVKTLPGVALVLALTFVRRYVLNVAPLVDFDDIGAVLTAAALIMGFMLAGVISDYKESEKLPGELAATLEAFEDAIVSGARASGRVEAGEFRRRYSDVAVVVVEWFMNRGTVAACYEAVRGLNALVADLERAGLGTVYIARCMAEQHNLRKLITRIEVIRRTRFIPAGYALVQMFVVTTLVLLIFSGFRNWQVQFLITGTLSLIYLYLLRLIRDLDDPFEYATGYVEEGSADVSPQPVLDYQARLKADLAR